MSVGVLDPDEDQEPGVGEKPQGSPRPDGDPIQPEPRPAAATLTCLAAFLAAAGAAWMAAGLFAGLQARVVAVLGAGVGAGMVMLSYRVRKPALVQSLVVPMAVLVGALLLLPFATGGSATLPGLVGEALQQGGLGQPPVPFDPGWRFLLLVFTSLVGAAAAALAVGLDRPRLSLLIPLPLLFVAALVQPSAGAVVSSGIALLLLVGGLVVCYGVELGREGATSGEFEVRRLLRGAAALALVVAVMAGLSQAGFLFPDSSDELVIPPQRPRPQPAQADRVVFTVEADRALPWRLGVLDVYDGEGWLTAPVRGSRLVDIDESTTLPGTPPAAGRATVRATFTVADLPGHVLPGLAVPTSVTSADADLLFDPRTQALRLSGGRPTSETTYTVEALATPTRAELAATPPPSSSLDEFLAAPAPPPEVVALLAEAPQQNPLARLQFVREAFYREVLAAGEGTPADLPPTRVVELLQGKEASPFEITAAEALLARWSGVPARIGFGYFGGQAVEGRPSVFEVRPRNGATWLETYFEGHGWVPIVGTPPRAKGSLDDGVKNPDTSVQATDELAVVVYVPLRSESIRQTYLLVRYWLVTILPFAVGLVLLVVLFPGLAKALRRPLRRRWARHEGARARIGVAYAELRDAAADFGTGAHSLSPLEFLACLEEDAEHRELAWLVTRTLWGDLTRDVRIEDIEACEEMAQSLRRRLAKANPATSRFIAFASKASLRDPYSPEMPNPWPKHRLGVRTAVRGAARRLRRPWKMRRPLTGAAVVLAIVVAATSFGGCGDDGSGAPAATTPFPERVVPDAVGPFRLVRAEQVEGAYRGAGPASLVEEGQVFTVHEGRTIQGSVQVATFKSHLGVPIDKVQEGVRRSIATGRFQRTRIGRERVWALDLPEQRFLLWFPPDGSYYQLMIARRRFAEADRVFAAVLAYQRGDDITTAGGGPVPVLPDPRRGLFPEGGGS